MFSEEGGLPGGSWGRPGCGFGRGIEGNPNASRVSRAQATTASQGGWFPPPPSYVSARALLSAEEELKNLRIIPCGIGE
jgi:hypothetical protein